MNILLTGANGFLGNYILKTISERNIITLGLSGCDYNIDLSLTIPEFTESFIKVVHAAGLAHTIPKSEKSGSRFFDINVTGTSNLLKALEKLPHSPEIFIFISTVSVYGVDSGENIDESNPLNGKSPYALSKIRAEELIRVWGEKNNVRTLILRLPLIVGSNSPGNLGTMVRAIRRGYYFRIGDGNAKRSMVLAEDVARFIFNSNDYSGIYNLTDGDHPSIKEITEAIAAHYGRKIKVLPQALIKTIALAGDHLSVIPLNTLKFRKLTSTLTFSDKKARDELQWSPRPVVKNIGL